MMYLNDILDDSMGGDIGTSSYLLKIDNGDAKLPAEAWREEADRLERLDDG